MNIMLNTDAAVNTFRPMSGLTHIGDIFNDALLAAVFSAAPCSVCVANDLPTVGPTYHDSETGGQFCLGCLEMVACDPFPEDGPEDPALVAYAEEWIATRRAARTAA